MLLSANGKQVKARGILSNNIESLLDYYTYFCVSVGLLALLFNSLIDFKKGDTLLNLSECLLYM